MSYQQLVRDGDVEFYVEVVERGGAEPIGLDDVVSLDGLTRAIDGTLDPFSSPSWDIQRVLPTRRSRRAQSADGMLALPGTESDYLPASIRSASSVA